ncbi:hypothetical protein Dimus_018802, partial [Dionaea muscipula]
MSLQSILELFGKKEEEQATSAVLWDRSGSSTARVAAVGASAIASEEVPEDLNITAVDVLELTTVGGSGDEAVVTSAIAPKKQRLVNAASKTKEIKE